MRQSKIGGELGDQDRYARTKVANAFVVTYTESASSVPRIPEIEDYVQDVVRGWSISSGAGKCMDLEGGREFLSGSRLEGCSCKGMEQQDFGLFGSYGVGL